MKLDYDKFMAQARERAIAIMAMRDNDGATFPAIGKKFGITYQRAQQIYKAAKQLTERK